MYCCTLCPEQCTPRHFGCRSRIRFLQWIFNERCPTNGLRKYWAYRNHRKRLRPATNAPSVFRACLPPKTIFHFVNGIDNGMLGGASPGEGATWAVVFYRYPWLGDDGRRSTGENRKRETMKAAVSTFPVSCRYRGSLRVVVEKKTANKNAVRSHDTREGGRPDRIGTIDVSGRRRGPSSTFGTQTTEPPPQQ